MNTKSAAFALGAIRTRSFRNAATNIQSASPDGSLSSPVTRMLPVVPNPNENTNKAVKGIGTCPICWSIFKTHSSDGTLHQHGPRSAVCPGSNQLPSNMHTSSTINLTTNVQSINRLSAKPLNQLQDSGDHVERDATLSDPPNCGLLKRIPKAIRSQCTALAALFNIEFNKSESEQCTALEKFN